MCVVHVCFYTYLSSSLSVVSCSISDKWSELYLCNWLWIPNKETHGKDDETLLLEVLLHRYVISFVSHQDARLLQLLSFILTLAGNQRRKRKRSEICEWNSMSQQLNQNDQIVLRCLIVLSVIVGHTLLFPQGCLFLKWWLKSSLWSYVRSMTKSFSSELKVKV